MGREREIEILYNYFQRMMKTPGTSSGNTRRLSESQKTPSISFFSTSSACRTRGISYAIAAVAANTVPKEIVFIKGYSGVGKSTLAHTMKKTVIETSKSVIFVQGKFDLNRQDDPYHGVAAAFGEICRAINKSPQVDKVMEDESMILDIGQVILSELATEAKLLSKLIPDIPGGEKIVEDDANVVYDIGSSIEKWKYAFRALPRVLAAYFSPIVLMFDDLQRADAASLTCKIQRNS